MWVGNNINSLPRSYSVWLRYLPNPNKVNAILKWLPCTTILEECGFLNIAGYYWHFIWGFTKEASALYKLLEGSPHCGSPIKWSIKHEHIMEQLKAALTSAELLVHPIPWHLFIIDTDTSGNCLRAVLRQTKTAFANLNQGKEASELSKQNDHFKFKEWDLCPITFESCQMTPTEQRYSAKEHEMLTIIYALQKWRGYPKWSPILIRTDHESLKHFLMQKHLGWHLACFADDIAHFYVEIMYWPGRHQLVANALLHRKGHKDIPDLKTIRPLFVAQMSSDEEERGRSVIFKTFTEYKQRLQKWEESVTISNGSYLLKNGILYKMVLNQWGGEIEVEVPITQDKAKDIAKKLHCKLGHLGVKTVLAVLWIRAHIPYAQEIVERIIKTCDAL